MWHRWLALTVVCCGIVVAQELRAEETPAGFHSIFNGKDLTGWQGNLDVWKVEDGAIVADTDGLPNNEFLATTKRYRDFALSLRFRLKNGVGNSGIQFRSERIPNHHEMIGYQADIGQNYWGCLYDESRRRKVLVRPPKGRLDDLDKSGWNHYLIRCMGNRVEMFLNDQKVVDYYEPEPDIPQEGLIAVQVHSSKEPTRVEFKDLYIQVLPIVEAEAETGFVQRSLEGPDGEQWKYSVFIPAGYNENGKKKWPTILFLHGSGETGTDGQMSAKVGIGPAVLKRQQKFPFIVVMPQAHTQSWKADSVNGQQAMRILEAVEKELRIDPDQIHLTGLSMGGTGAWSLASAHPDRFASVSVLCGQGEPEVAKTLEIPVWTFCGDKDGEKTVNNHRTIHQVLQESGKPSKYTEYPEVGHNCWDLTYENDALYQWMLSKRR